MSDLLRVAAPIFFGLMTVGWGVALAIRNTGVVDFFWGLGLFTVTGVFFLQSEQQPIQITMVLLVGAWAVRLSGFLFVTRVFRGKQDPRYLELEKNWKRFKPLKILLHFYLQATIQWCICMGLAAMFVAPPDGMGWIQWGAIGLFCISLWGESVADWQLYSFKKNGHSGVCDVGLWGLSRHPNYFCEWLIWVSFALLTFGSPLFYVSLISPVCIFVVMRCFTGPYTEKLSRQRRGSEYSDYQNRVPMFFPRPKFLKEIR